MIADGTGPRLHVAMCRVVAIHFARAVDRHQGHVAGLAGDGKRRPVPGRRLRLLGCGILPAAGCQRSGSEIEYANGDETGGLLAAAWNAGVQKTTANGKRERRSPMTSTLRLFSVRLPAHGNCDRILSAPGWPAASPAIHSDQEQWPLFREEARPR